MLREPVESSTLASVGYSKQTSTLELEFKTGSVYRYFAVPASVIELLMKAESKGAFFHKSIKDSYPYARG